MILLHQIEITNEPFTVAKRAKKFFWEIIDEIVLYYSPKGGFNKRVAAFFIRSQTSKCKILIYLRILSPQLIQKSTRSKQRHIWSKFLSFMDNKIYADDTKVIVDNLDASQRLINQITDYSQFNQMNDFFKNQNISLERRIKHFASNFFFRQKTGNIWHVAV